jgi:YD repeat-containing protein
LTYQYDANNDLTKITTPEGRVTDLAYTDHKVTSITQHPDATTTAVTGFTYNTTKTTVTDPNELTTGTRPTQTWTRTTLKS